MAGVAREIDVAQLPGWLDGLARELQGMSFEPVLQKQCRQVLVSATLENFAGAHGPDGQAWPSLKMRAGRPLHKHGLLSGSITGGAGHVEEVTGTTLKVGTNLAHASVHQPDGRSSTKITAPAGKALAIPLTPAAERSRGPRSMSGLSLVWPKGDSAGRLLDQAGKAQFLLVKSVTIPARPFIGWNDDTADKCALFIADYVEQRLAQR
jgi:phage gpG-like protein